VVNWRVNVRGSASSRVFSENRMDDEIGGVGLDHVCRGWGAYDVREVGALDTKSPIY
jgi:hypothetical protein